VVCSKSPTALTVQLTDWHCNQCDCVTFLSWCIIANIKNNDYENTFLHKTVPQILHRISGLKNGWVDRWVDREMSEWEFFLRSVHLWKQLIKCMFNVMHGIKCNEIMLFIWDWFVEMTHFRTMDSTPAVSIGDSSDDDLVGINLET